MIDPDRARLVAAVVVVLVAIAALGIGLVVRGLLGVPRVSGPRCRACRHGLRAFGREPSLPSVCPECGAELKDESRIVHAVRVPGPWTAAIGVGCLVVVGASAFVGRSRVVHAPLVTPGPPIRVMQRPPPPPVPLPTGPWPATLTLEQIEQFGTELRQVPHTVFLASAPVGLGRSRSYLAELVDRVNDGSISERQVREVIRDVTDLATRRTRHDRRAREAPLANHLSIFRPGALPPWLREELLWLASGAPFIAVPRITDGSVPIRIAPRPAFIQDWRNLPPEVHQLRLIGEGVDLELRPIPPGRWFYEIPMMLPRGRYEVRVDLERVAEDRAQGVSGRDAGGPSTVRQRIEFVRTMDLVWPGDPLVRLCPDPEFAAVIREAHRDAFVSHRHREGRPDVLRVFAVDRSWRTEFPERPAVYRLDIVVGDVRVPTDHLVSGAFCRPIYVTARGELEPGELPDPLPATVTLEFHPEPDLIDDYAMRATTIPSDVIRMTDVPLIVNPGPEWLPDG